MSYISFTSKSDEKLIRGSERAHMGVLISDLFVASLRDDQIERAVPKGTYLDDIEPHSMQWFNSFGLWIRHSGHLLHKGVKLDGFTIGLNTAMALGGDPLKLFARLHGQCEIHAWLEGGDREWLAGIIQEGMQSGLYRANQGWPELVEWLLLSNIEEVVTSYSVTYGFPDKNVADWDVPIGVDGEPEEDAWYELPQEEQWERAISGLRQSYSELRIQPATFGDYYFDHGVNAFQIGLEEVSQIT